MSELKGSPVTKWFMIQTPDREVSGYNPASRDRKSSKAGTDLHLVPVDTPQPSKIS